MTWLVEGEAVHHDSLGSEQLIKPGQLNLMSAGMGVAHSEEATGHYEGTIHGVQLWIAQPEATRNLAPAFEHHRDLARIESAVADITVLIGEFSGVSSAARRDSELVGVEIVLRGPQLVSLRRDFEYCLIVLDGALFVGDQILEPGTMGFLAPGDDELALDSREPTRVMLLGGVPFESEIVMWWNFVARSRDEIDDAFEAWRTNNGRFGTVKSDLTRIASPPRFWRSDVPVESESD